MTVINIYEVALKVYSMRELHPGSISPVTYELLTRSLNIEENLIVPSS